MSLPPDALTVTGTERQFPVPKDPGFPCQFLRASSHSMGQSASAVSPFEVDKAHWAFAGLCCSGLTLKASELSWGMPCIWKLGRTSAHLHGVGGGSFAVASTLTGWEFQGLGGNCRDQRWTLVPPWACPPRSPSGTSVGLGDPPVGRTPPRGGPRPKPAYGGTPREAYAPARVRLRGLHPGVAW